MDGVDAAIVRFADNSCETIGTQKFAYPESLRSRLISAIQDADTCTIDEFATLDILVAECFRDAVHDLLASLSLTASDIAAIGSHGQTLRHQPDATPPFTVQIGDPNHIASGTGITTVADFRRRDVAEGGQGAPLAPAFHQWLFAGESDRVVLNVGGIANITCMPTNGKVCGFDTGPGNTLLDAWNHQHNLTPFDEDGNWSAGGTVLDDLLEDCLDDDYFRAPAPKSTGFEYFNLRWLAEKLGPDNTADPRNIQSTLCELTASTIAAAIKEQCTSTVSILVCGGGVHNRDLMSRLERKVAPAKCESTASHGLDPDWVEAAAFAWLARRTLKGLTGNLASVTGAKRECILGGIYRGQGQGPPGFCR